MTRIVPIIVVIALALAGLQSVRFGIADEAVAAINGQLNAAATEMRATGAVPSLSMMRELDAQMASAIQMAPRNGFYELSHLRLLRTPRQSADGVVAENLPAAYAAAKRAVVLLPASTYAWADYALLADRLNTEAALNGGDAELYRAISRAMTLGPREVTVATAVLDVGLANGRGRMTAFPPDAQGAISGAVTLLGRVAPQNAIEVASRRGELAWLCQQKPLTAQPICNKSTHSPGSTG